MSIGLIVTARVKSSRLQEKVLQEINGRRTIDILLDHVIPTDDKWPVVLAIPESSDDDILEEIANERGIQCYRGQNDSPLHRLYECAYINEFEHVIRVTADDILIDQALLRAQINFHIKGNNDYTYMRRCPEGVAAEIIRTDALKAVIDKVGRKPVEFVSYYLKTNDFRYMEYFPPSPGNEFQFSFRLTMDYYDDLILLRVIHSVLKQPFGTLDIINFLKQNKYLLNINKLPEVTVYTCNYNTAKYVKDCIESVMSQSFKDFEFIIIDDCSTDNSMNVITEKVSEYGRDERFKIQIIRNSENMGLPACCNKILSLARGKHIIRIDSDDILAPNAIERMLEQTRIEDTAGCITGYYNAKEQLSITSETLTNEWHPAGCLLNTWTVNELKYKEELEYLEGDDFFKRFKRDYKISFIPEPLWTYRSRPGQKTQQKEHPNNK